MAEILIYDGDIFKKKINIEESSSYDDLKNLIMLKLDIPESNFTIFANKGDTSSETVINSQETFSQNNTSPSYKIILNNLSAEEVKAIPLLEEYLDLENELEISEKDKGELNEMLESTAQKINKNRIINYEIKEKEFFDSEKINEDICQYFKKEFNNKATNISKEEKDNFVKVIKYNFSRINTEIKNAFEEINSEVNGIQTNLEEANYELSGMGQSLCDIRKKILEKIERGEKFNLSVKLGPSVSKKEEPKDNVKNKKLEKFLKITDENGNDNISLNKNTSEVSPFIIDNIYIENISDKEYKIEKLFWNHKEDEEENIHIENDEISFINSEKIIKPGEKVKCKELKITIELPIIGKDYCLYLNIVTEKDGFMLLDNSNNNINTNQFLIAVEITESEEDKKLKLKKECEKKYEQEIKNYGKEFIDFMEKSNFDEEKIEKWIKKKKEEEKKKEMEKQVNKLFSKLDEELKISSLKIDDKIREKIIELNFDEGKIREYILEYISEEKKLCEKNKDAEVQKIFDELDDEYHFKNEGIIDEDELTKMIRENINDKQKIKDYIESLY